MMMTKTMIEILKIKDWKINKKPQLKSLLVNDFKDILTAQRISDSAVLNRGESYSIEDCPRTFITILEFEKNLIYLKYEIYRDDSQTTGNSHAIIANGRMTANEINLWSESIAYYDAKKLNLIIKP